MTLLWNREQRATIAALERWRLPGTYTATYAPHDIEIAHRDAVRARVRRRQRLTHQLAIAIGWYAS